MPAILLAEDDPDDRFLAQRALQKNNFGQRLLTVDDGVQLLDYLRGHAEYADRERYPMPGLILLDLNMPRMDGRDALVEIRNDPDLQLIPVIILTNSDSEEDIAHCYRLGANSYISKPSEFPVLMSSLNDVTQYWFGTVELPRGG